jgi:hypothetical protein
MPFGLGVALLCGQFSILKSDRLEQTAEVADSGRVLVAQALLPVRFSKPSRINPAIDDRQNRTGRSACATFSAECGSLFYLIIHAL